MPIYARIINDIALDVVEADNDNDASALFGGLFPASDFTEVPEGTLHGAVAKDDGSFDNPVTELQSDSLTPIELTKNAFIDHVVTSITAARFRSVMTAARDSSDDNIFLAISKYDAVATIERDLAQPLLAGFVALGIGALAQAEMDAIIDGWPTV